MSWTIENRLPDRVRIAWFDLDGISVLAGSSGLRTELAERARELRRLHADPASAAPLFQPARRTYHRLGIDPSKHRPSSEALVRRILQGKELFEVNTAVDAANLASISHHCPVGLYDADRIVPWIVVQAGTGDASAGSKAESNPETDAGKTETKMVKLRLGLEGEEYPGIGKEMIHLAGRPAMVDRIGPFGNPSSDSDRTKVTLQTKSLLFVLFEPPDEPWDEVAAHLAVSRGILVRHVLTES